MIEPTPAPPNAPATAFPPAHYRAVGWRYFTGGFPDRADAVLARAVADHPDDGRAWELLGCVRWAAGDLAGARSALESASALVPLAVPATLALADAYLALGPADLARTLLTPLARPGACPPEFQPRAADLLFRAGEHRAAKRVWARVRRRHPARAEAHYRYALCLWALDADPVELLDPLNEAAVLAPDVPRYAFALANVWADLGEYADAAAVLDAVRPGAVDCPECRRRAAAVYRRAGRPAAASAWDADAPALG